MRLRFDEAYDGYPWPGPLDAGRNAAFGEQWVGPRGLLGILETQLGIGGPADSDRMRAAALVAALRSTEGFWTASATVDPMGTARTLLHWRDTLAAGGWDRRSRVRSPRLRDLSKLEDAMRPGVVDRVRRTIARLSGRSAGISLLQLTEDRTQQVPIWRQLLGAVEASGTRVTMVPAASAEAAGDLAAARKASFEPKGDGSLQLLRSNGPLEAAEAAAAWAATLPPGAQLLVVSPHGELDLAFKRYGLPTVGAHSEGGVTNVLEILPLVISLGWSPSEPARAMELLTLPTSPVPKGIRHRLANALKAWPAVGSDAWQAALQDGLQTYEDRSAREALCSFSTPHLNTRLIRPICWLI